MRERFRSLPLLLAFAAGSAPPTEFRLFKAGLNPTENGYTVLFDERAAELVMAATKTWGVELMVDLDHESLDQGPAVRADQKDARAWLRLEVRNGELWAVNVSWTPDGLRRLTERTQRYVSPAFETEDVDAEAGIVRVTAILNVALCAMPATRDAVPLVASKRPRVAQSQCAATFRSSRMTPEQVKKAMDIVANDDGEGAIGLLKDVIAGLAGGSEGPPAGDAPPPEGAAKDPTGEVPEGDKPKDETMTQALSVVREVTQVAKTLRAELDQARSELATLTTERDARDMAERGKLVAELVKLGKETPATAFEKDAAGAPIPGKLCKRLVSEPVADMRERVKELRASMPAAEVEQIEAPATPTAAVKLTDAQKALAKKAGLTEEQFIARREKAFVKR